MAFTSDKCFTVCGIGQHAGKRDGLEMCCSDVGRAKFRVACSGLQVAGFCKASKLAGWQANSLILPGS